MSAKAEFKLGRAAVLPQHPPVEPVATNGHRAQDGSRPTAGSYADRVAAAKARGSSRGSGEAARLRASRERALRAAQTTGDSQPAASGERRRVVGGRVLSRKETNQSEYSFEGGHVIALPQSVVVLREVVADVPDNRPGRSRVRGSGNHLAEEVEEPKKKKKKHEAEEVEEPKKKKKKHEAAPLTPKHLRILQTAVSTPHEELADATDVARAFDRAARHANGNGGQIGKGIFAAGSELAKEDAQVARMRSLAAAQVRATEVIEEQTPQTLAGFLAAGLARREAKIKLQQISDEEAESPSTKRKGLLGRRTG